MCINNEDLAEQFIRKKLIQLQLKKQSYHNHIFISIERKISNLSDLKSTRKLFMLAKIRTIKQEMTRATEEIKFASPAI